MAKEKKAPAKKSAKEKKEDFDKLVKVFLATKPKVKKDKKVK